MKKYFLLSISVIVLLLSSCASTHETIEMRNQITEQTVFIDAGNLIIPATLTLPKGNSPVPVVIMEHGTGSQKDEAGDGYKMLAPSLAEAGIASLRFDFPGSGDSTSSYLLYTNEEAIRETQIVADYLSNLAEIDGTRIGLLGWSQGGSDVLLAASENDTYKSVATWAGALIIGDMASEEMRAEAIKTGQTKMDFPWRESLPLSKEWIDQADNMDILAYATKISSPIGSFHGTEDKTVPFSDSEKVQARSINPKSRLIPIEGADHTFLIFTGDLTKYYELRDKTVEWFVETL